MLSNKQGMTLMEIIVVLIIVGIAAATCFPNFTVPGEQARSTVARNNLLAIYSAEQNFNNNNGGNGSWCNDTSTLPCTSLANINSSLSLNIEDDGSYTYGCAGTTCTATRTSLPANNTIIVTLNAPTGAGNPVCILLNNWCPP